MVRYSFVALATRKNKKNLGFYALAGLAVTSPVPLKSYLPVIEIGTEVPVGPLMVNGEPGTPHRLSEVEVPEIEYVFMFGSYTPLVIVP